MKKVIVTWDDAHAYLDSITIDEAKALKAYRTDSIGYLIAKTKHGLTIAYDEYPDGTYGAYSFIPAGMVVKVRELK